MRFKTEIKFLMFGLINLLITNISLQMMLLIISIPIATFISQIINFSLGYICYGKFVFQVKKTNKAILFKYILVAIFSWLLNSISISLLSKNFLVSKGIAALLMIPFLTLFSFFIQKKYVFAKN